MTRGRAFFCYTLGFALLVTTAACGGSAPPPPPTGGGRTVDSATTGTLSGRAVFAGTAPGVETLRMTTDKACVAGAGPNPQSDAVLIAAEDRKSVV